MKKTYEPLIALATLFLVSFSVSAQQQSSFLGLKYYSCSLNPGLVYINSRFSNMELKDDYAYLNKRFFSLGGSIRTGWFITLDSSEKAVIETGIDLYRNQAALVNSKNEKFKLYQEIFSIPVIFFTKRPLNLKVKNCDPKVGLGFGPIVNINYGSYLAKSDPRYFESYDYKVTSVNLGLQLDNRFYFTKDDVRGHVFGIRANVDLLNIYSKKADSPFIDQPLFTSVSLYYNLMNKSIN